MDSKIQTYLGDLNIEKKRYNDIQNKLSKVLKYDLDLLWFPGGKKGIIEYLEFRSQNVKGIRIDTNKLLEKMSISLDQYEEKLDQLLNYNTYKAIYVIGDPKNKRDLDLVVSVNHDVKIPLSTSEYTRLLSDALKIDADKVREEKLDINFVEMDCNNNIIQSSKGVSKFTQTILHFTYPSNRQIYNLDPFPNAFLPNNHDLILHLELINYIDSIIKKILDSLKKLDPTNYKLLSKEKGRVYNSDSLTRLYYVINFMDQWLKLNKNKSLTTDQQEVLKSITIKVIQFLLWRLKIVNEHFFSKEGALDTLIELDIEKQLNKEQLMKVLYILPDNNVTSEFFKPIFEIFKRESPNYIWNLPGPISSWNNMFINSLSGDDLFDAIRINNKYDPIIEYLYQKKYSEPKKGQILNIQNIFIGLLNTNQIQKVRNLLPNLEISELNPRSPEWIEMLSDPKYKFGDNTGIRVYQNIPDWKIQLADSYHLLQGMIAEQDIINNFKFNQIFPNFELIEVGAIIQTGPTIPQLGVCPDGLLVKNSHPEEIIPIEIKKINLEGSRGVQRELDLAIRQLARTQTIINQSRPNIVKNVCIILYDFNNFNAYYKIL
jgi:hypothetical protein